MQVKLGGWSVIVGVDWSVLDKPEVAEKIKQHPGQSRVQVEHDRQFWLGFHDHLKGNVYAGAMLIGLVVPNAVVFVPLNEDEAWLCHIKDGLPYAGRDTIMPVDEARESALGWQSMANDVAMVGDIPGASMGIGDVVVRIEDSLKNKAIKKKDLARVRLQKPASPKGRLLLITAVVAVSSLAFIGGRLYFANKSQQMRAQQDALSRAQQALAILQGRQSAEMAAQAQIAAFQKQVDDARKAQVVRINPLMLWSAATRLRVSLGLSQHGYKPDTVTCGEQGCNVHWVALNTSVPVGNKLLLPNVTPNFNIDTTADSAFQFASPLVTEPMPVILSTVKSGEELKFWLYSTFKARYSMVMFDQSQPVTVSPPKGVSLSPVVVGETGKWSAKFTTTALVSAPEFLQSLAKWPVRVTSIKVNGGNVDLEGEYVFLEGM